MKTDIHPTYDFVVYRDRSADYMFLSRSTLAASAEATVTWEDGQTYPVIDIDVSSASHPFYTGKQKIMDTAGRVEKFNRRYGKGQ